MWSRLHRHRRRAGGTVIRKVDGLRRKRIATEAMIWATKTEAETITTTIARIKIPTATEIGIAVGAEAIRRSTTPAITTTAGAAAVPTQTTGAATATVRIKVLMRGIMREKRLAMMKSMRIPEAEKMKD